MFRNFLDAEAKKAGYEGVFKWDEWCFSVNQVCAIVLFITMIIIWCSVGLLMSLYGVCL